MNTPESRAIVTKTLAVLAQKLDLLDGPPRLVEYDVANATIALKLAQTYATLIAVKP